MQRIVELADRHEHLKAASLVLLALTALSFLALAAFGDGTLLSLRWR